MPATWNPNAGPDMVLDLEADLPGPQPGDVVQPTEFQTHAEGTPVIDRGDSQLEDILHALGDPKSRKKQGFRICPKCGAPTKLVGAAIGVHTVEARCTKCRYTFPVATAKILTDSEPVRPPPVFGPYKGSPDRGDSAPPMDPSEPIHRRLSEMIRRSYGGS